MERKKILALACAMLLMLSALPSFASAIDWYEPAAASDISKIEDLCEIHTFYPWWVGETPTCMNSGWQIRTCGKCGFRQIMYLPPLPHSYSLWETIVEYTDHSAGVQKRTCTACGKTETKSVDPLGTLRLYAQGPAVKDLQKKLYQLGYLSGRYVDGDYGPYTEYAVRSFQEKNDLTPDGIAWPQTLALLR